MITYKGQSAESNVSTGSKTNTAGKLDFRFADEEDAKDISMCISAAYSVEFDPESTLYNRKDSSIPVVTEEQVANDCYSPNLRWIVLETPVPEELVVAAARLSMASVMEGSKIVVDMMAFAEDTQSTSIKDQMLVQIERVARSQNIKIVVIETSQHRDDIHSWLEQCGYEELGGRMSEEENYKKATMVFEFHKDLTKPSKAMSRAPAVAVAAPGAVNSVFTTAADGGAVIELDVESLTAGNLADALLGLNISSASASASASDSDSPPAGGMAGLMSDLFSALHKEHGEGDAA
jgi:N-acetylglutamate synthase-like GNAT family acetyltransferase